MVVEFESSDKGNLSIKTNQIDCDVLLASVGLKPLVYDVGGIMKKLEIYRLPRESEEKCELNFKYIPESLKSGDNPIFVKVVQQDGHMAWSSPIYMVSS